MTPEDEEFNRIEREAKLRMEAVSAALDKKAENARELGLDYEPRAWFTVDGLNAWADKKLKENPQWAEQPAQQEPVAYLCENAVGHKYFRWKKPSSTYKPIALYTSPPAQQKPLKDDEIEEVWKRVEASDFRDVVQPFARAIEAAHGIKEQP